MSWNLFGSAVGMDSTLRFLSDHPIHIDDLLGKAMKYSLRSLMIGVTLVCVVLGGRIEYLRRMAAFHQQEADRCAWEVERLSGWNPGKPGFVAFRPPELPCSQFHAHVRLAQEYGIAVYRPWTVVESPLPPKDEDEMWRQKEELIRQQEEDARRFSCH